MKNLIECGDYDLQISKELIDAKIELVRLSGFMGNEPVSFFVGKLGAVIFERGYATWHVKVNVPFDVVKALYEDPAIEKGLTVRNGAVGEIPLESEISYLDKEGKILIARKELPSNPNLQVYKIIANNPELRIVENPIAKGKPFFIDFFIHTETALRLFADALKKHNLV